MNDKLRVLSLFSGIGAFERALEKQNIDYELVGFSEIDKFAIESYCVVHDTDKTKNLGDISKVQDLQKFKDKVDLIVGGSPCQDFSIAGKQQGSTFECLDCKHEFNPLTVHYTKRNNCPSCSSENLERTRSSLLIEYLRTIREIKPKYFVYENVKNIVGKKFKDAFNMFKSELKEYGYNTHYQVLNAKDYGIPQNRERVFVIGIRNNIEKEFRFPQKQELKIRLKDVLEDLVDEKYYYSKERTEKLIETLKEKGLGDKLELDCAGRLEMKGHDSIRRVYNENGVAPTLTTMGGGNTEPKIVQVNNPNHFSQRVYSSEGISPTIAAGNNGGGKEPCKIICEQRSDEGLRFFKNNICGTIRTIDSGGDKRVLEPLVAVKEATKKGYAIATIGDSINMEQPNSKTRRGRVGKRVAQTLTTSCNQATLETDYKIRKLTPKECWRLMGFEDEDIDRCVEAGISNSQLYKQAGNSIVVSVLEEIFKNLL